MGRLVAACLFAFVSAGSAFAQSFDPYQIVGFTPWCQGFNPYNLLPGQRQPVDLTIYDAGRCAPLEQIDQETVTKISLPEVVVWAPGSEYAFLVVHQTDRGLIQNVLVQVDGLPIPIRHAYFLTGDTRRLAVGLHDLPELRNRFATISVLVSCSGGCSSQVSMRDASNIWPHPTIVNGQPVLSTAR